MLTLVGADGRIHHKLNHTSTVTGRLSSSDPNMQNIPRGDKSLAKRMFVSRFKDDGRIIEIDYSQLEVIVQGVLSGDKQLCADIREGVDFHVKRLSAATGKDYSDLKRLHLANDPAICAHRTQIKGFTFQRAYGAGVTAIADSTGMSPDRVRQLIDAEEAMYPRVSAFDREVEDSINRSSTQSGKVITVDGITLWPKEGTWFSPTGTKYIWKEHETPQFMKDQGKYIGFSPTERKNWPVQGLGGEIVQTMIGKVWRQFSKTENYWDKAYLVNTVHDCILIDCHTDVLEEVCRVIPNIMERVPNVFNYYFNMKIDVPFPVSVEVGNNWYDMEHYTT
jgi:DNA polymerase I-like protein with 3'-5' exonuclease and polymerase domains